MNYPVEIAQWATRHGVAPAALAELGAILGSGGTEETGHSESNVQSRVRLAGRQLGMRLWRNNVGVLFNENGVPVRYGLANDSPALNKRLKSADLIGWRARLVEPAMVGHLVAQFVSLECKAEGWRYRGDEREQAQQRWAALVAVEGGYSRFVTGPNQL